MTVEALLVYCTCPDDETTSPLAELLVSKQLAACVNIITGIQSVYAWQGKVETSDEALLLIKTTTVAYDELETLLREQHPYELPEIVAVPFSRGLPDYLEWINQSVR
ncbi:MAG: divalent-cation tolerance protein CutA [Gammaproteobacteria bacterium]